MDFKTATDNVAVDKASGDIWLAGLVKPYAVIDYLTDPSNPENVAPSQVTHTLTQMQKDKLFNV